MFIMPTKKLDMTTPNGRMIAEISARLPSFHRVVPMTARETANRAEAERQRRKAADAAREAADAAQEQMAA